MGMIADGKEVEFPGVVSKNFVRDDPSMELLREDWGLRKTRWIRSVMLHTTMGNPPVLQPGSGPPGGARDTLHGWRTDERHAGSHIVVDFDGTAWCVADLTRARAYDATTINDVSVGIELCQVHRTSGIYEAQLDALVLLCDGLTKLFEIQRQFHWPYLKRPVKRLADGGVDCVGLFGHRDQSDRRGFGDPGDLPFAWLEKAGYQPLNYDLDEDLALGKSRQRMLNALGEHVTEDGVVGPATCAAKVRHSGRPLWVVRPND